MGDAQQLAPAQRPLRVQIMELIHQRVGDAGEQRRLSGVTPGRDQASDPDKISLAECHHGKGEGRQDHDGELAAAPCGRTEQRQRQPERENQSGIAAGQALIQSEPHSSQGHHKPARDGERCQSKEHAGLRRMTTTIDQELQPENCEDHQAGCTRDHGRGDRIAAQQPPSR
jgi:hypothetical protein